MSQGEGTVLPFKEKLGVGEGASLALALCRPPVQHQGLWCGRGQVSGESLWDKGDTGPSLGHPGWREHRAGGEVGSWGEHVPLAFVTSVGPGSQAPGCL